MGVYEHISIHAPTRGATTDSSKAVGADIISIHAPTRGATIAFSVFSVPLRNFNPRSHEGSDLLMLTMTSVSGYFNPRSHEGSDAAVDALDYLKANFNPRSHEGSD